MKNFMKLLMLIKPAREMGYYLTADACSADFGGYTVNMYGITNGILDASKFLLRYSMVTDDKLEPAIHEVLDHLTSKVLPTGENNVVVANGKLFSVTKKDDCFYCWSDDEIGELLKDEVIDIIEGKFQEEQND